MLPSGASLCTKSPYWYRDDTKSYFCSGKAAPWTAYPLRALRPSILISHGIHKNNHTYRCGYFYGGGGGSRTPVRKRFLGNFSGRRRLFAFPRPGVSRHTPGSGSFIVHGALKALRTHVHHSTTPRPGSWSFRAGRSRLKPRQAQRYRCSLIYKLPVFRMSGPSARCSPTRVPVETSTPPSRRKLHIPRFAAPGGKARSFRCSSPSRHNRLRWVVPGGGVGR